jgi:hypothetical protein
MTMARPRPSDFESFPLINLLDELSKSKALFGPVFEIQSVLFSILMLISPP